MINDEVMFNLGTVEPKIFNEFENGRMVTYGFSIHRDENGIETHRTAPRILSSIGWANGESFTKKDFREIKKEG